MPFEGWQNHGQGTDDFGNNFFSIQLKKLHTNLETKIKQEAPTTLKTVLLTGW